MSSPQHRRGRLRAHAERESSSQLWKALLARDRTRPRTEVDLGSAQTTEHDMFPRASALGLLEAPSNETTKVASARVANVALVAVRDAGRATRSVVKPRPKVDTVEKVEEECKGGVHPSVGNVLRTVQII